MWKRHVHLVIIVFLCEVYNVQTRSVPRSSSRTFRFPESGEATKVHFKDISSLFVKPRVQHEVKSNFFPETGTLQRTNSVINLDDTPIKILVPESPVIEPKDPDSGNEDVSSENILLSRNNTSSLEDEPLLEVLCPESNKNISNVELDDVNDSSIVSSSSESKIRYDLREGKCGEVGKPEHCGENMIFVADIDSAAYGYCECDYGNKVLRKNMKQAALFMKTPLVFHQQSNACYRLYEQAYCNDNEWVVLSRVLKSPVCEKRQCSSTSGHEIQVSSGTSNTPSVGRRRSSKLLTPSFWSDTSKPNVPQSSSNSTTGSDTKQHLWVPLNGSGPCVQLFSNNPGHCADNEQVVFNVGDIVPKCGNIGRGIQGRAIIRNACPPGSYYSIIGRCQPDWDF